MAEEEPANRAEAVPSDVQEELKKLGADHGTAARPFAPYVVEEGRPITGQNPFSAGAGAEAVVRRLAAE
ncbi:hypothetical protein AB0D11_35600 [Streptomyces monashensis]|uniref:hypothetical protein n=1 Tax=Streptomyces monashensis TaxID=1678012 RepID=UPI0033D3EB5B